MFAPLLLAAGVAGFCVPGSAASRTPEETVDIFVNAYNARDFENMKSAMAADAFIGAVDRARPMSSGKKLLEVYRNRTFKMMPGVRIERTGRLRSYDVIVQTEKLTWDRGAELGMSLYQVRGGCIVRMEIVMEPKS